MSAPINDGGPAFPCEVQQGKNEFPARLPGMTLRDWFAGQVIGHFAAQALMEHWQAYECANDAYAYADAMMKAREAQP